MTIDTLETRLAELDPALNLVPVAEKERTLEDILAGRRSAPADSNAMTGQGRGRRGRAVRLALVGAAATVVVAVPILGTGEQAYAGWTAYPAGLALGDESTVTRQCQTWVALSTTDEPTQSVLSEQRGEDTLTLLRGSGGWLYTCHQHLGSGEPNGGSSEARLAEPAPDGLVSNRGSAFSAETGEPIVRIVMGRVGGRVRGVTVQTEEQGDVVATVRDGYFAAWWPGEASDDHSRSPLRMEFSFTAALSDGSTRHFARPASESTPPIHRESVTGQATR